MTDRSAVVTTYNGQIIEWKVFDSEKQAYEHYNNGITRLREMIQRTPEDGDWEIMLCDIKQYALSKPHRARDEEAESEMDWYTRYVSIMANRARRLTNIPSKWSLHVWMKLREGMGSKLKCKKEERPTRSGL